MEPVTLTHPQDEFEQTHAQKHEQHERADTQQRCFKNIHPETRDRIQNVPHLRFETSLRLMIVCLAAV